MNQAMHINDRRIGLYNMHENRSTPWGEDSRKTWPAERLDVPLPLWRKSLAIRADRLS